MQNHYSPQTVNEAVSRARRLHEAPKGALIFGDDVEEGVAGLASDAGPPAKIFEHLEALACLAAKRRAGPLGMTMVKWLERFNVAASGESESIRTNGREMDRRSWRVDGERRPFFLHTKPDRCVRIYFCWDPDRSVVVIGWIGRHP